MIKIEMKNIKKVKDKLTRLPKDMQKACYDEAAMYLIGDPTHGLKYYPPQVTTNPSRPMYVRTYNLYWGWEVQFGKSSKTVVKNKVDYAQHVYKRWAGMPWNWKTIAAIIKLETPGMMKAIYKRMSQIITASGFGWSGKE